MPDATKNEVIVLAVIEGGMAVAQAAQKFHVSRRWIHTLLARYRDHGIEAVAPRSKAPHTSPHRTPTVIKDRVLALRDELIAQGLDAGAESIHDRLTREALTPPSPSTIYRILRAADKVIPEPHKRPRSSWTRFESPAPNGCWQSDMTHWHLTDGTGIEIITWLDDHSRFLTHLSAHHIVTGQVVIDTFTTAAEAHGLPASTLTDNGRIYTARFAHGTPGLNKFEQLIRDLGITQKNGHPGHPQTQGKIERFHQTLKRWLSSQPEATTLDDLNTLLAAFQHIYNHERPHRANARRTPAEAYEALPKASPSVTIAGHHYRIRFDHVDTAGVITLRHAGTLRHLAIGRAYKHQPVLVLINGPDTLVINRTTGEILAEHTIDPSKNYQPQKQRSPSQRRGSL